jgi:hypothetical protein
MAITSELRKQFRKSSRRHEDISRTNSKQTTENTKKKIRRKTAQEQNTNGKHDESDHVQKGSEVDSLNM